MHPSLGFFRAGGLAFLVGVLEISRSWPVFVRKNLDFGKSFMILRYWTVFVISSLWLVFVINLLLIALNERLFLGSLYDGLAIG